MKAWILAALIGVTSSTALAQTAKKKKGKKLKKSKKSTTEEVVTDSAVESTKATSKYPKIELFAGGGWGIYPLVGFWGGLGYASSDSSIWEAAAMSGSGKVDYVGFSYTLAEFRWKKFWLGPVYTAQGLSYRSVEGKYNIFTDSTQTAESEASASTRSLCLDVAIGTHFRFGTFGLGADLVGINYQVASLGKTETLPEAYDKTDAENQKATYDKVGGAMTTQLGKVYISLHF